MAYYCQIQGAWNDQKPLTRKIEIETEYSLNEVESIATHINDNGDVGASVASGSFLTEGMLVASSLSKPSRELLIPTRTISWCAQHT